jgi:hypothetical protein
MSPIAPATGQNVQGPLLPVSSADVAAVVARPEKILAKYQALAPGASADAYVRGALGANFASLASAGCFASYAAQFAGSAVPEGFSSLAPQTASLEQLLTDTALGCGHYCKLAMLLTLLGYPGVIPPDASGGDPPKPTMHFAVWVPAATINIGYHSQLVLSNVLDNAYLLLDPMYAFAMRLPYAGAYPMASHTVLENAAALLQTPSATADFVDLWPANTVVKRSQVVTAMMSGTMGPAYIYNSDPQYGADGWDRVMAGVIANMA